MCVSSPWRRRQEGTRQRRHFSRVAALVTAQSSSSALARVLQPAPTHPAAGADTHIPRAPEWSHGRERLRVVMTRNAAVVTRWGIARREQFKKLSNKM